MAFCSGAGKASPILNFDKCTGTDIEKFKQLRIFVSQLSFICVRWSMFVVNWFWNLLYQLGFFQKNATVILIGKATTTT